LGHLSQILTVNRRIAPEQMVTVVIPSSLGLRLPEEGLYSRSSKVISNKIQVKGKPILEVKRVVRLTCKNTLLRVTD
jgi:hypothetical protein